MFLHSKFLLKWQVLSETVIYSNKNQSIFHFLYLGKSGYKAILNGGYVFFSALDLDCFLTFSTQGSPVQGQ